MFQQVKIRLAGMFTLIVAGLQFLFSFGFLVHQMVYYNVFMPRLFEFAAVLITEILFISIITFIVGYFFVKETIKPAEDMFERLDQFTIDASHELKTPLGIANSSLDLALRTRKYKQYITESKTYIKKASNLVEKMLELARLDHFSMSPSYVDVNHVVERVIKTCQQDIKKKDLQLVTNISKDLRIKADNVLLERALENLIENACKFNTRKGRIEITITRRFIKIENTGKTVPSEELAHIFDRFYQSDASRSAKGYGIGLAIVKKICDLHGWRVSVESANTITSFTISFPSLRLP